MKKLRSVSRRSFMATVVGGATAGALGFGDEVKASVAQGCSDNDPSNGGDPAGRGRHCNQVPQTGCSDSDPSSGGDPAGAGRHCTSRPVTGCSDRDPGDPSQHGRNCTPSCSDTDRGQGSDPSGQGRHCGQRASGGTGACTRCNCGEYVQPQSGNRCARATCGHTSNEHALARSCTMNRVC